MSKTATATEIEPVVKTVDVKASPARAFEVFTARINDWWPRATHSISSKAENAPAAEVVFEPRVGGRVYEIAPSGAEHPWGTVTACEPGVRVVFTWRVGRPESEAGEVEVSFDDEGGGVTRVTLVHRGWENIAEKAREARDGYDSGWDGVLKDAYVKAIEAA
jgi:uncharacterized protein YndB with AHSA1/START domain